MSTPAEKRIYTQLTGYSALTALVSTRIYPIQLPQACPLPAIRYNRISTEHINSFSGYSSCEMPSVQFDVFSSASLDEAKQVVEQLIKAMDAATTYKALPTGQRELFESDPELYRISIDFWVWNEEE